jgi:OFA family oxalate/formate antiporter-like MFS transporter
MPASPPVTSNRWLIATAGTVVMICLGVVYAWSIFTTPLIAIFHWSNTVTTWAFALAIFSLGWGAVLGGRWQDKVGPRVVTLVGVLLWGLGNLLAGLGTERFGAPWLYATYGIMGGLGNGMAYITPVAVATKWFPDKRGLGSGMVVMGFGLGAFFYNQIVPRIDAFAIAAKHASAYVNARTEAIKAGLPFDPTQHPMSGADVAATLHVFVVTGVVIAVVGGICAAVLRNPPPGYAVARTAADTSARSYAPLEVLRTHQFYFLWLMLFLNVTAGILIISNAVPIYGELTGAAVVLAAQIYGVLAIFNGLGRFFWGAVSDRIGRNLAYALLLGIQAVTFLLMGHLHSMALVGVCFAIVLLCYGGGFGTMPSFNADYFGTRHLGANYGMILTAWGFGGIVGPLIGSFIRDRTGSFNGALLPVAIMLLAGMVLPLVTHKPRERLGHAMPAPT